MSTANRESGKHEVAVGSLSHGHIGLEHRMQPKATGKQAGLIVEAASLHQPIDFLQANHVRTLMVDAIKHPLDGVAAIAAPDPLVNVPGEKSHESLADSGPNSGYYSLSISLSTSGNPGTQDCPHPPCKTSRLAKRW